MLWAVYAVFWAGGVIAGGAARQAAWAPPAFLGIAATIVLLERSTRERPSLVAAALIGFASELIGVHSGVPFGTYRYTTVLGPAVAGVPLAIAFAWVVLIDFALAAGRQWWRAALLMTAADLVIDPLASGPLHYWQWLQPGSYYGVPMVNFAGWLIVCAIILVFQPATRRFSAAGCSVLVFFSVLAFENRLWVPAGIGCVLAAAPGLSTARVKFPLVRRPGTAP